MAGDPQGTVSIDILPSFRRAGAEITRWQNGLRPVELEVVTPNFGNDVAAETKKANAAFGAIDTRGARAEIAKLGATARKELTAGPFGGTGATRGFAVSNQERTVTGGASPFANESTVRQLTGADALGKKAAKSVDTFTTSAAKSTAVATRFGGSLRGAAGTAGDLASEIAPLAGELGPLASGLGSAASQAGAAAGAITAAVAGFSFAWSELKSQTAEGVAAITPSAEKIVAAFDPTKPQAYRFELEEIARTLAQVDEVGDLDAWDKIQSFVGIGDDSEDRANAALALIESVKEALNTLSIDQGNRLLGDLPARLEYYGLSAAEAQEATQGLQDQLDERASIERATADTDELTAATGRYGFALDTTKSKLIGYYDSLGQAFSPIQSAMSAQEAYSDGLTTLSDAQKTYQDIVNGNTDGLKSATESLRDAREELNKAIAETGPGSEAAEDALESLHNALRALHDAETEQGKAPEAGDFFEDKRFAVLDAAKNVADAQRKLDEINSGNSDQVVAARDRVTDAQQRYNEELAKTGPASDEAIAAQERVQDAMEALPGLALATETAEAALREEMERHPAAVQATIDKVDDLLAKGLISVEVADAWKRKLLEVATAAGTITFPGQPLDDAPNENRPGGALQPPKPAPTKQFNPNPSKPGLTDQEGMRLGLGDFPLEYDAQSVQGADGNNYRWDKTARRWLRLGPGRARGGPVWEDTLHPVNELGPEMFTDRTGNQYLMPGAGGGTVTPTSAVTGDAAQEIRMLRAEMMTTFRDMMRTFAAPGATEPLIPVLREIERNTRTGIAGTSGGAMASMRSAQAEFAR